METTDTNVAPAAPVSADPAPANVAPTSAPEGQDLTPAADPQPSGPKPPSRTQQRIDELTRQRYEEQRRADDLAAKIAHYERQQSLSQQFTQLDAEAPQIDQFNSLAEYGRALSDWTTKRATAVAMQQWEERMQAQNAQQAQYSQRAMVQQQQVMRENVQLEERMAAGVKKYADFQQVLMNPELPSVRGTPLFNAVLTAQNSPDIAYSLAKNPAELERLLSIRDPMQIAYEVFRLDAKFTGNVATSAPPPPPARNGSSAVVKDLKDMNTAEHIRAYQEAKRRKAGGG